MFHTKDQIKKIRDLHIGAGVLIYRSGSSEVCETEFSSTEKRGSFVMLKQAKKLS